MSLNWIVRDGNLINSFFFNRGIIVVKFPSSKDVPDKEIINHQDRYSIQAIKNFNKQQIINKQKLFLEDLINIKSRSDIKIFTDMILFNKKRRDEIFLPLLFTKEEIGIYINVWIINSIKSDTSLSFGNVNQFITAGCIFGSRLKAIDKNSGAIFPLINIDMNFFSDKQIEKLIFDENSESVYESLLFNELETYAKLIELLSSGNPDKTLYYHFPYYDYLIFATVLLVRNRLSYQAFKDFHQAILDISKIYIERITTIFKKHNIALKIESPYQNIFDSLEQRLGYESKEILNKLEINSDQLTNDLSQDLKEREKDLIQKCWYKLIKNSLNSEHQEIWEHFSLLYSEPPNSFKELLERANAMMVARVAWKKPHYSTCSMLPHSEKQIQIGYSKLLKSQSKENLSKAKNTLSGVINLTIFDTVVACSDAKKVGLFNCDYEINNIPAMVQNARGIFFEQEKINEIASSELTIRPIKN